MKEEVIVKLLNDFAHCFSINDQIENLEDREIILGSLKDKDQKIHKLLHDFIILVESFNFVKKDKMLMLKARDVWKMEVDRMYKEVQSAVKDIAKISDQLNIEMPDFK